MEDKFMSNFVDLRKELGEDGFNDWFTDKLVEIEDLFIMGFASAGPLMDRLKQAYGCLDWFDFEPEAAHPGTIPEDEE